MNSLNAEGGWEKDEEVSRCPTCNEEFGMLLWKHHCRKCGKIFCDACTASVQFPPHCVHMDCPQSLVSPSPQSMRCCGVCGEGMGRTQTSGGGYNPGNVGVAGQGGQGGQGDGRHGEGGQRDGGQEGERLHCVDALELDPTQPTQLYSSRLPVLLDNRLYHIRLSPAFKSGDCVYVWAN
ncbi:hypothetical protein B484DRAFT_416503, partial [Ochromonadaceae sp. CCMP2298]